MEASCDKPLAARVTPRFMEDCKPSNYVGYDDKTSGRQNAF